MEAFFLTFYVKEFWLRYCKISSYHFSTLCSPAASLSLFCSTSSHPTFPSQTSCPVPCSHDLPLLCNVLHMLPWKGNRSHNAISTFQNVPHCAHESKAQHDVDLNRKLRHNCTSYSLHFNSEIFILFYACSLHCWMSLQFKMLSESTATGEAEIPAQLPALWVSKHAR